MFVQPGLCGTRSETPKTNFLTTRLICSGAHTGMLHCRFLKVGFIVEFVIDDLIDIARKTLTSWACYNITFFKIVEITCTFFERKVSLIIPACFPFSHLY